MQNLGQGNPPVAGPPNVSVAGRRLMAHLRRLLQGNGVAVSLNINSPSGLSDSVNQALQQAINSGAFQASLANSGTSHPHWNCK